MAKRVSSWEEIPDDLFEKFSKAVEALFVKMVPRDVDGDYPFSYRVWDKRKETLTTMPVRRNEVYSYDFRGYLKFHPDRQREMDSATERDLSINLSSASDAVRQYFDLRDIDRRQDEDKKPSEERWCPHPKCRARLRDGYSRRGVNDKDICMNPFCPTLKTAKVKRAIAKAKKDAVIAQEEFRKRVTERREQRKGEQHG